MDNLRVFLIEYCGFLFASPLATSVGQSRLLFLVFLRFFDMSRKRTRAAAESGPAAESYEQPA